MSILLLRRSGVENYSPSGSERWADPDLYAMDFTVLGKGEREERRQ
jgi:hypothetical protein